ncbi:MAG TPA: V-type ATPase 116kDa subunit family protein [Thiobacillaceae bacterium]|nr:V-type ATPase 116kDa subunit family protein [Thiobacillaceae bacterium]HNU64053.1 V-type ATPase 116kDa subunit family protein [Thiobacillaceae bacterium]
MFRAEPMLRVRLALLTSEAPDAALELARFGVFSPTFHALGPLDEATAESYREAWLEAEVRTAKLVERCASTTLPEIPQDAVAPTLEDLRELNIWLKQVWNTCLVSQEEADRVQEERRHLEALQETLGRLGRLNVDLAELLSPDSLLSVHIGSLPAASERRVGEALSMTGSLISNFDRVGEQVYAVIASPRDRQDEVRGLLSQAGWRELPVPHELRTHPQAARAWLEEARQGVEARNAQSCANLDSLRDRFRARLDEARQRVALGRPLAEAAVAGVRGRGSLAVLTGWVPRRSVGALQTMLTERFGGRYWLNLQAPGPHEADQVPSLMRYPGWLRPFVPLVKSYGVPRYGEFDPTLPFAFLYLLLFGAMFGDVGHGAVIMALALMLYRKLGRMAWVGVAAGVVSMLFGLLYGSVFGYEDLISPVWMSPLHNPTYILAVAIALGVGFIVLTLLANIHNRFVAGHRAAALFDATGLAGLFFYLGAVGAVASLAGVLDTGPAAWGLALAGIAAVAVFKWMETRAGLGEKVLVTAIETLEAAINLFANTLSFMRVAAFSLNHVALALAVFAIANGLGAVGHGLTIFLGNVIIIVLEGGIVAIQALRLMYYEGFSRFFIGSGTEFTPLKLADVR